MNNIERRFLCLPNLETRAAEGDQNILTGYAAVFYQPGDSSTEFNLVPGEYVERFAPGAFDETLRNDDILCLFNHERSNVLGRNRAGTLSLSIDNRGLKYDCQLPETTCGRDMRISLERRDVSGSSIGFEAQQVTWTEQKDGPTIRLIERAKLYDVSPVTYAAYQGTEAHLRSAGQLNDTLQAELDALHAKGRERRERLRKLKIAELRQKMWC